MGFFNKEKCPICEREIGFMDKTPWRKDGSYLCAPCYKRLEASGISLMRLKQNDVGTLRKMIEGNQRMTEEKLALLKSFNVTRLVGNRILIDEKNKLWAIGEVKYVHNLHKVYGDKLWDMPGHQNKIKIFNFSDIIDFELLEDGYSVTKGGVSIGKALLGDFLVGWPGFIVGGVTGKRKTKTTCYNMQIKITLNDFDLPMIMIPIITTRIPKGTKAYKNAVLIANEILSCLNIISNANDKPRSNSNVSIADEIKKFKDLLDSGAISEQEYEAKKKQLLE